jgi:tRNA (cmo5U34)-methyltransferase
MTIKEEFNTWLAGYTEKMTRWVPYYQELLQALRQNLPPGFQPANILDFGCGNGNATTQVMAAFPNAHYVLLDGSNEMLDACRQRFDDKKDIQYVETYFQDADFPDNSFDLITAAFALHHLDSAEKAAVFKKIYRWLRPGGVVTSSDIYGTKRDPAYPQEILATWKAFAMEHGTPTEEWDTLMEHHAEYDKPDTYADQLQWLHEAGFAEARIAWHVDQWGNIQGIK